ncbi:transcriptional regulator, TetR family [Saccharopolyspora kobensis]|uniref:Transcriptional regulator, TetR family n=1 Tax=Saccharopolyspora kobensis TaxID=146035 RepID=A0A1H5UKH8_9PSEU|nr:TetR/AcrR family transcriptional regulator [Saccharopolyspora kobensis]SEF74767.1 transcriptional regulator, TetR family [Saccharopolyspora kobensis]SFC73016.1 transcriptional regulator, TetR family [Saccharopolyspora kobensis]
MSPVNKRAEKARQTRARMLRAAGELFVERGYGATPLQDIADRAGVAVQTIYFTFRNKRNLLKEVVDTAIAGDDEPVATMDRPWFRDALETETAEAHLRAHVAGTRRVLQRVAEIVEVLRVAAATDPEVVDLWPKGENPRYTVQAEAAKSLVAKPGARPGLSATEAADILFALLSPELYLLLVRDRAWTPERWEQWARETLHSQLVL